MNIGNLISFFDNYIPLDEKEKEELRARLFEKNIKRRHFVLQRNEICCHYTFVVEGLLRMYSIDANGIEHNLQFASENDWISDMGSFHSKKPSQVYIEAMEPSIILQIEKSSLMHLYSHFPKFDRTFRVIIENKYMELENRILQNISSLAEERYQNFLDQNPKLSNRLSNIQIASYLGITPEFLSKIRNVISKKTT